MREERSIWTPRFKVFHGLELGNRLGTCREIGSRRFDKTLPEAAPLIPAEELGKKENGFYGTTFTHGDVDGHLSKRTELLTARAYVECVCT